MGSEHPVQDQWSAAPVVPPSIILLCAPCSRACHSEWAHRQTQHLRELRSTQQHDSVGGEEEKIGITNDLSPCTFTTASSCAIKLTSASSRLGAAYTIKTPRVGRCLSQPKPCSAQQALDVNQPQARCSCGAERVASHWLTDGLPSAWLRFRCRHSRHKAVANSLR